jgi:hypothetical protein
LRLAGTGGVWQVKMFQQELARVVAPSLSSLVLPRTHRQYPKHVRPYTHCTLGPRALPCCQRGGGILVTSAVCPLRCRRSRLSRKTRRSPSAAAPPMQQSDLGLHQWVEYIGAGKEGGRLSPDAPRRRPLTCGYATPHRCTQPSEWRSTLHSYAGPCNTTNAAEARRRHASTPAK